MDSGLREVNLTLVVEHDELLQAEIVLLHVFCRFLSNIAEMRRVTAGHTVESLFPLGIAENKTVIGTIVDQPAIEVRVFHIVIFKDVIECVVVVIIRKIDRKTGLMFIQTRPQHAVGSVNGICCHILSKTQIMAFQKLVIPI